MKRINLQLLENMQKFEKKSHEKYFQIFEENITYLNFAWISFTKFKSVLYTFLNTIYFYFWFLIFKEVPNYIFMRMNTGDRGSKTYKNSSYEE